MAKKKKVVGAVAGSSAGREENFVEQVDRFVSASDAMFHAALIHKELAIACVKELFPEQIDNLDLDALTIEPNEFYSAALKKQVADLIYTIPWRNSTHVTKVALILEHKAQSSPGKNRATLAQVFSYVGEYCRRIAEDAKDDSLDADVQPIPIVIYTGSDASLDQLIWGDSFRVAPGFEEYAFVFPVKFVNMTRLRLEGKLPENPVLEAMYDTMTRHHKWEFDGFAQNALRALRRIQGKWSPAVKTVARSLLYFCKLQMLSAGVKLNSADVRSLIDSGNLEENMEEDAFYEYFAPRAEKAGFDKGEKIGFDKGEKIGFDKGEKIGFDKGEKIGFDKGKDQERASMLDSQRATLSATVRGRFGDVPAPITTAINKAQNLDSLVEMRVYTLTSANSLDDLVAYAQTALY